MKNRYLYITSIFILLLIISYITYKIISNTKNNPVYSGEMNTEAVSKYNPDQTYDWQSLDSLDFVQKITTQKLQEVLDLASVSNNDNDLKIKQILSNQLKNYFLTNDTMSLKFIYDSVLMNKNYVAKISEVEILQNDSIVSDTLGKVNFSYHLFDKEHKNNYILTKTKSASYILKRKSDKLKKEFKYYFTSFSEKDTIRKGVAK